MFWKNWPKKFGCCTYCGTRRKAVLKLLVLNPPYPLRIDIARIKYSVKPTPSRKSTLLRKDILKSSVATPSINRMANKSKTASRRFSIENVAKITKIKRYRTWRYRILFSPKSEITKRADMVLVTLKSPKPPRAVKSIFKQLKKMKVATEMKIKNPKWSFRRSL